jgi:hypothetical protein
MSEGQTTQPGQSAATETATEERVSACPHPEAVGRRWGDPISEERQVELQGYLDRWQAETDHGQRKGPFDSGPGKPSELLTGADVGWLAEQSGREDFGWLPNLHLEGANLRGAHLEGAHLEVAHLEGAFFIGAHLEGSVLMAARLEGARLDGIHLETLYVNPPRDGARRRATVASRVFITCAYPGYEQVTRPTVRRSRCSMRNPASSSSPYLT